jgi:hypothetical protein
MSEDHNYYNPEIEGNPHKPTVIYDSWNWKIIAPEGTVYVFILEDRITHKPLRIHAFVGKAGGALSAMVDAMCRVISRQLERGLITLEDIQEELSGTTTDKNRTLVRSVPEAIHIAIVKYKTMKFLQYEAEIEEKLGTKARIRRRDD